MESKLERRMFLDLFIFIFYIMRMNILYMGVG